MKIFYNVIYYIQEKGDCVIKEKSKGLLIVVSGPSGAGKDTICNKVIEDMKDTKYLYL